MTSSVETPLTRRAKLVHLNFEEEKFGFALIGFKMICKNEKIMMTTFLSRECLGTKNFDQNFYAKLQMGKQ